MDELEDLLGGDQPGREGAVQSDRIDQRQELLAGDSRQGEPGAHPLGVEGGYQVGPVVAGAGDEGTRPADPDLFLDFLADPFIVDHMSSTDQTGDLVGPLPVLLEDRHVHLALLEQLGQRQADPAAAEKDRAPDRPDLPDEIGNDLPKGIRGGRNEDVVTWLRDGVGTGEHRLVFPLDPDDVGRVGPGPREEGLSNQG